MDEDLIQILRRKIEASKPPTFLSFDEAKKTTRYSQELLNEYRSTEGALSSAAAFQLEAFLTESIGQPVARFILLAIAGALRGRMVDRRLRLGSSDLRIGLILHEFSTFNRNDVESLVTVMKGAGDFHVASEAPRLLPIIGRNFMQDYLRSTELFETGGIGGPQRPLIREMASDALRNFDGSKKK